MAEPAPQGYHWVWRTVTAPRDPDLIALLSNPYANAFASLGFDTIDPGSVTWHYTSPSTLEYSVQELVPDAGGTAPGGPPGGGGGGGGGAGGSGLFSSYEHVAKIYGRSITGGEVNELVKLGVDPTEFALRLERLRWLNENKDQMPAFRATLENRGLIKPGEKFSAYDFIKGLAPQPYYRVWEQFAARAAAGLAGFEVGGEGPLGLGLKAAEQVYKRLPGTQEVADLIPIFSQAAQLTLQNGSWANYKDYGLHQRDWLAVAGQYANANQYEKVQRVIAEKEEFLQLRQPLQLAGITGQKGTAG